MNKVITVNLTAEETRIVYDAQIPAQNPLFPLRDDFSFHKRTHFTDHICGSASLLMLDDKTKPGIEYTLFVDGDSLDDTVILDSFCGRHSYTYEGTTYTMIIVPDPSVDKPVTYYTVPAKSGEAKYMVTIPTYLRYIKSVVLADEPVAAIEAAVRYLAGLGAEINFYDQQASNETSGTDHDFLMIDDSYFSLDGVTVEVISDVTAKIHPTV